jgi:uncharacterized repeat protein (TIGR03803 family)
MGNLSSRTLFAIGLFCVATVIASSAQTFSVLFTFDKINGDGPLAALIQGTNGDFYGATPAGANGGGALFELKPSGQMAGGYSFCALANCEDGNQTYAPLLQTTSGDFVGLTTEGGSSCGTDDLCGTFFKINSEGKLTTLYNFCSLPNCADGYYPASAPLEVSRNFYGAIAFGGAKGSGLIYEITGDGTFSSRYAFCSRTNCSDGSNPIGLVHGANGNFYGATELGGGNGYGTIFEITPASQLTTLYNFTGIGGDAYASSFLQANNGRFYGTALNLVNYEGEIFEVSNTGDFSILYNFCPLNCQPKLSDPGAMIQASDGNFYGIAGAGGANLNGGIFRMTPAGKVTTYLSFPACGYQSDCPSGFEPGGLMQGTDGNFYGVMGAGGWEPCFNLVGCGTVYKVTTGIAPFVAPYPNYGKVGSLMRVIGNGLTGTTNVTFNGTQAAFNVVSDTYITATVPTGASSGLIEVTTPTGTLKSNVAFRVPR